MLSRLSDMNLKVSDLQKILGQAAKDDGSRRFHSLYDKICRKDVLWAAWLEVLANDGSGLSLIHI